MSAASGGTLWFFCNHLYSVYRLNDFRLFDGSCPVYLIICCSVPDRMGRIGSDRFF